MTDTTTDVKAFMAGDSAYSGGAAPKPTAKPAAGRPKPAAPRRTGPQETNSQFEGLHARDASGHFTSGPDLNRGPQDAKRGDEGRKVQTMQDLLAKLGYTVDGEKLAADGKFGPKTEAALRRAQENYGIRDEQGVLGPKTRAAMAKEYESIGGGAYDSNGKARSGGGGRGGSRSKGGGGKRGSGKRGKGSAKKKATAKRKTTAAAKPKINDPRNLADGKLTPSDGRWGQPWPKEWGKEPPRVGPKGIRRAEGYPDGSAVYEGGYVWDPDTHKFRLQGANAYEPAKKKPVQKKEHDMTTHADVIEFKRSRSVHLVDSREHKGLPIAGGVKILQDDEGIVEAVVSVTGVQDEVNDVILPGAYTATLAKRLPKGVFSHDWEKPVARTLEIKELMPGDPDLPTHTARGDVWPEGAGALLVKCQFNLATQQGREAYENVKFYGDEQEWSIGYNVPRGGARIDQRKGLRYINKLDLFEYSPVLFGAMPLAGTTGAKELAMAGDYGVKTLPGSFEELADQIREAYSTIVNAGIAASDDRRWVWLRATMPDYAILSVSPGKADQPTSMTDQLYKVGYERNPDGTVQIVGEPVKVRMEEIVVPDVDKPGTGAPVVTEHKGAAKDDEDPLVKYRFKSKDDEDDDGDAAKDDDEDGDGKKKPEGKGLEATEGKAWLSLAELDELEDLRDAAQ